MTRIIIILLCIVTNFGCSSVDSGAIIWSQISNYRNGLAHAIATDESFIYIAASDYSKGLPNGKWRIEKRRSSDGSLVSSFGNEGVISSKPGHLDRATGVAVDSQLKLKN